MFSTTTVRDVNIAVTTVLYMVNGIRLIKLFLATPFHWIAFIFVLFLMKAAVFVFRVDQTAVCILW
jgi:hypothetical protein